MYCLLPSVFIFTLAAASSARQFNQSRQQSRSLRRGTTDYVPKVHTGFAPATDETLARLGARGVLPAVPGPNLEQDIPASLLPNPLNARFIKDADYAGSVGVPPTLTNGAVANAQPQAAPGVSAPTATHS
ncbi:hypothetical protein K488DRAFT_86203 [Vararia minispora EC-137]|uniref:Uncharacterized protein n=1 Tax=Vararia minispora EC-137 TaxID=1314806 RepID=A0ACB8QKE6_9AGAM|nr:hypothetical protein K488DRAFT_86203 [Vararia minispora EC-137]